MKAKNWLSLCFLALCLLLAACSNEANEKQVSNSDTTKHPESSTTEVVRLPGSDWGFPSPYLHNPRGPGFYNMYLIYDGLLEKDENGIIPWLAKEWKISEDGKVYTFTLQEGVTWHDGQPFTAEDVKFSFDYFQKHKPVRDSLTVNGKSIIESIEIISDTEITITLNTVAVTNLEKLGWTRMIPKHIWESIDSPEEMKAMSKLIGTGPFKLTDYEKEQGAYRFEAVESFWGPKQATKAIEQVPVSDPAIAFEQKELDYTAVSADLVDKFKADGYEIQYDPPFFGTRLLFNLTTELQDPALRQAIAYAINREELVEKVLRGAGISGNPGYLSPENKFYSADVEQYEYNLEKAKELLAGKTYSFTLKTANNQTAKQDVALAELIKLQLEQIGIQIDIISSDLTTNDAYIKDGDYELALQTQGGYGGDPDNLREIFRTKKEGNAVQSVKIPGYSNTELDKLADAQLVELDHEKRQMLVTNMQQIIAQDLPALVVYYKATPNVVRQDVFNNWIYMYDHHWAYHAKLSYLQREN